jgi:tetraacyldisaccharide 4'-kinase
MSSIVPFNAEAILSQAWLHRGWLAWLLLPLSLVFRLLIALRRALYAAHVLKSTTLPLPVIVVGNIFVGGTGKTPLVIWLVRQLSAAGFVPGVISRGYGRHAQVVQSVVSGMSPFQVGDEPLLIAQKTHAPMMVGRNRVAAARALMAAHPEVNVIISDDGLQHYALGRTLEIQLSDARGHGNGWLLPAGPLREPVTRRSDFYVVNSDAELAGDCFRMRLAGAYAEQLADRSERLSLSSLHLKPGINRIAAAAGIGNPHRFFSMLAAQGVKLAVTQALPDHFDFAVNPFAEMEADLILITEKDAVKCAGIDAIATDKRLWVVPVEATIEGSLAVKLVEKLHGRSIA